MKKITYLEFGNYLIMLTILERKHRKGIYVPFVQVHLATQQPQIQN